MFAAFQKSMSFATFSANTVSEPVRLAVTAQLFAAASRGELQVVVDEVLPLDHAIRAHQRMDAGNIFGKLVLTP
jgi:NADPH:quinone reductase-like Zn-dependent oxidoreductase